MGFRSRHLIGTEMILRSHHIRQSNHQTGLSALGSNRLDSLAEVGGKGDDPISATFLGKMSRNIRQGLEQGDGPDRGPVRLVDDFPRPEAAGSDSVDAFRGFLVSIAWEGQKVGCRNRRHFVGGGGERKESD